MIAGVIIFWIVCGVGAAMSASSKGRSAAGWFFGGLLLGPIALLIVGFMSAEPQSQLSPMTSVYTSQVSQSAEPQRVKCPFCAEMIMPDAKICRFCGRDLPAPPQASVASITSGTATSGVATNIGIKVYKKYRDWSKPVPVLQMIDPDGRTRLVVGAATGQLARF